MENVSEAGVKTVAVDEVNYGRKQLKELSRCIVHKLVNHVKKRGNKVSQSSRLIFIGRFAVILGLNNVRCVEGFKNGNDTERIALCAVNCKLVCVAASVFICY